MPAVRLADLPKVTVVIPHFRDLRGLDICLSALAAQTYPKTKIEIVVADNNSPEGREAVAGVVAGRAELVVVMEKGAGPARNGGVAASTGEVLAFIDSDCVAEPGWIEEGVRGLETYDLVGGRVRVLLRDPTDITPVEAFERVFAFDFKTYIERKRFTGAGNLFCPKALFLAVGGFKPAVSEDKEWSQRAQAASYRLGYVPLAIVGHPARRTWAELLAKWKRINVETFILASEAPCWRMRWLIKTLLLPASAVVHSFKVLFSPELASFRDRVGAINILFRLRFWRFRDYLRLLNEGA